MQSSRSEFGNRPGCNFNVFPLVLAFLAPTLWVFNFFLVADTPYYFDQTTSSLRPAVTATTCSHSVH